MLLSQETNHIFDLFSQVCVLRHPGWVNPPPYVLTGFASRHHADGRSEKQKRSFIEVSRIKLDKQLSTLYHTRAFSLLQSARIAQSVEQ